ncbi:hypothetical protein C1I94_03565 [Akkermansia muciniphila]|nr:hypothetical protein C1I94_03565 [Akkermansia muciniphila]QAA47711.1 hypothetical protein C1O40_03565 [Akkermansia muciniphila]QAA50039.1 hypothetical protein C1O47_03510 [Akkermansia muciniphila]QHV11196.1 hypothetical protein C5N97_03440 [Akkermansia muciniphila]
MLIPQWIGNRRRVYVEPSMFFLILPCRRRREGPFFYGRYPCPASAFKCRDDTLDHACASSASKVRIFIMITLFVGIFLKSENVLRAQRVGVFCMDSFQICSHGVLEIMVRKS